MGKKYMLILEGTEGVRGVPSIEASERQEYTKGRSSLGDRGLYRRNSCGRSVFREKRGKKGIVEVEKRYNEG